MGKNLFACLYFFCLCGLPLLANNNKKDSFTFTGTISKIDLKTNLVRVKSDFDNLKFLKKSDEIYFWTDMDTEQNCRSYLFAKGNSHFLLRVPYLKDCLLEMYFTTGSHLYLKSKQFENTLRVAREVSKILLKKRLAIQSRVKRYQQGLDIHLDKVESINKKYRVIEQKLQSEWQNELSNLEKDRHTLQQNYNSLIIELQEIDHKLQLYQVTPKNLKKDRWSLNSQYYFEK